MTVTTEMLQALDEFRIDRLTNFLNQIYDSGYIPEDMKKSTNIKES